MRFKIDENLHQDVADFLSSLGHDSHTVVGEGLQGGDDIRLPQHFLKEDRILVTLDKDFPDIREYPPQKYPGIIVLRVGNQSRPHILKIMANVGELLGRENPRGQLWIVSETGVRIRN